MDLLEEKIKRFLEISSGSGSGSGYGSGSGSGSGDGSGYGSGYGDGSGSGDGSGDGYGDGSGYGYGYGSGDGDGSGSGYGSGYGDGSGSGDGDGSGSGYGSGYGDGYGSGIEEFNGHKLHDIDGVPTHITAVFGHYAKGFTVERNSIEVPCYIARVGNSFAHGETIRKAMDDAMSKDMQRKPLEERIAATVKKYPDPLSRIPNSELFTLHNLLTGSCEYGRRQFCQRHGISLDDSMTMEKFISLTINDYGGVSIKKLSEAYKKK